MQTPNYLVLADDGNLYPYWSLDILLCNLAEFRRGDECGRKMVRLYQRNQSGFVPLDVPDPDAKQTNPIDAVMIRASEAS